MVNDAFRENMKTFVKDGYRVEAPKHRSTEIIWYVRCNKDPSYDGCKDGILPLSSATRMMSIKPDYNLREDCVDAITDFVKDILSGNNLSPNTYYEIRKLVSGLGLLYQIIYVYIDNCILYCNGMGDCAGCWFCPKQALEPGKSNMK